MATIDCLDHHFESIEAIVFDKDGTLAQVEDYLQRLGNQRADCVVAQSSVDGPEQSALMRSLGVTDRGVNPAGALAVGSRYENLITAASYLAAQGHDWIASTDMATLAFAEADQYFLPKAKQTPLIKGVEKILSTLKGASLKLAILSADSQTHVEEFAHYYALTSLFDCLQGTSPGMPAKTEARFLHRACEQLQVQPHQLLVIGDSAADLRMAQVGNAAGFIGFTGAWKMPKPIAGASISIDQFSLIGVRK